MNSSKNEQWLNQLLASPPSVADKGFSEKVVKGIQQGRRKRQAILTIAWLIALVIVVLTLPTIGFDIVSDFRNWSTMNSSSEIVSFSYLNALNLNATLLFITNNILYFIAGALIIGALLKNNLLANK